MGKLKLHEETMGAIARVEWLYRIGVAPTESLPLNAETVDSWEAADAAWDDTWDNLRNRFQGDLTAGLSVSFRDRYRDWNLLFTQAQKVLDEDVSHRIHERVQELGWIPFYAQAISDDTCTILVEATYRANWCVVDNVYPALFHIYQSGHLPCGWSGEYPEGSLLIY
ncbi:MAG: hypothetical protein ACFCBW_20760 [Candidatus Competibacterales bacterium]